MKSRDPLDPSRLEVRDVRVYPSAFAGETHTKLHVMVSLDYEMWFGEPHYDVLWEHANALHCIRAVLQRGGVGDDFGNG